MHLTLTVIILATIGGIFPVLIWLWFWEHEEKYPEPKKLTLMAFIAGMIAVPLVLPFEQYVHTVVGSDTISSTVIMFILWAAIEEIFKFIAAYMSVLRRAENHEPIDSMMYMITTALGFAALENVFFLLAPLSNNDIVRTLITSNLRFIGANLLHVIASGTIGIFLSLSFYKSPGQRRLYALLGVILAIVLHAAFNLSIILNDGANAVVGFYTVWIAIVFLLLFFEKIKAMKQPK